MTYIEREALLEELIRIFEKTDPEGAEQIGVLQCLRALRKAPVVDLVSAKRGWWLLLDECSNAGVYCSNCHKKVYREESWYANVKIKSKYCPNCGAKMDLEG